MSSDPEALLLADNSWLLLLDGGVSCFVILVSTLTVMVALLTWEMKLCEHCWSQDHGGFLEQQAARTSLQKGADYRPAYYARVTKPRQASAGRCWRGYPLDREMQWSSAT